MSKLKYFVISMLSDYLLILVLFCITACVFTYTNINDAKLEFFAFGSIAIANAISSIMLNHKIKNKGIIYGALLGAISMLGVYLVSMILFKSIAISSITYIYFAVSILSGILGGIIGVNV